MILYKRTCACNSDVICTNKLRVCVCVGRMLWFFLGETIMSANFKVNLFLSLAPKAHYAAKRKKFF